MPRYLRILMLICLEGLNFYALLFSIEIMPRVKNSSTQIVVD
jgi:hypothetical protein